MLRLHGVLQDIVGEHVIPCRRREFGRDAPGRVRGGRSSPIPNSPPIEPAVAFGTDHEVIAVGYREIPASVAVIEVLPPISGG